MSVPALRAALADEMRVILALLAAETVEWREARDREVALRPARDAAIRRAVELGASQAAAAAVVGVTRARPGQIIAKAKQQQADNHEAKGS